MHLGLTVLFLLLLRIMDIIVVKKATLDWTTLSGCQPLGFLC